MSWQASACVRRHRALVDPGQDVVPDHLALQIAQEHVPAVGIDDLGARLRRQAPQHRLMRAGRHDLVARAAQHQERPLQAVDRRRGNVHELDQAGDRIDPGRLDEQRIGADRAQHLDVV